MLKLWGVVALCLAGAGCSEEKTVNNPSVLPMFGAVQHARTEEVRRLAERGQGLDERKPSNEATPMIFAAGANRWTIVEILLDHGADIWAHDKFGVAVGEHAVTSRLVPGTPEDEARLRVMEKMKARGYPFPPPDRNEILRLDADGKWPPAGARAGDAR